MIQNEIYAAMANLSEKGKKKMKQSRVLKSVLFTVMSLALSLFVLTGCTSGGETSSAAGETNSTTASEAGGDAASKEITVLVVHGDQSEKSFTYQTDEEFLGPVLKAEGLVDGEESSMGIFIKTVDGETVDDANQEWWCLTKGGESLMTGADSTPIADGDQFELTLTVGY